jgi:hypothetical protein
MGEPSEAEMATQLRARATALRSRADAMDIAAEALDGVTDFRNAPEPKAARPAKPGRVSKALRPTKGGAKPGRKPGKTRALLEARLAQHPLEDRSKTADALGLTMANLAYHLKQIRKAA